MWPVYSSVTPDILNRTLSLAILSCAFLVAKGSVEVAALWAISTAIGAPALRRHPALLVGVIAPALPIALSYLVIEPLTTGHPLTYREATLGAVSFARVSGLTVLSLAWLESLSLNDLAALGRASLLGQWLVVPGCILVTSLMETQDRWRTIREVRAFRTGGTIRRRRQPSLSEVPALGLSLALSTLSMTADMELSCRGRGLLVSRRLATPPLTISTGGIISAGVSLCVLAACLIQW